MKVDASWEQAGYAPTEKPTWQAQLENYQRGRAAPRPDPLAAIFDRLTQQCRTWMSLVTSGSGRDAVDARQLRPALDSTIVHVARLCMRDERLLSRIGDGDALRAVTATMAKIKAKEND